MQLNTNRSSSFTMLLMMLVLLVAQVAAAGLTELEAFEEAHGGENNVEESVHPSHSVLYASLVLTIGIVVYYTLSRFLHWIPYTAMMFLLGAIMGLISASRVLTLVSVKEHYLQDTLFAWQDIDSEVLLLVFLPGLIFKDALGQNPYLFAMGFNQLFIFAFPNVLAGTFMTAVVGYYIFPYAWPFYLCLTFGAIMSATDPVAVSALLEEVGTSYSVESRRTVVFLL